MFCDPNKFIELSIKECNVFAQFVHACGYKSENRTITGTKPEYSNSKLSLFSRNCILYARHSKEDLFLVVHAQKSKKIPVYLPNEIRCFGSARV